MSGLSSGGQSRKVIIEMIWKRTSRGLEAYGIHTDYQITVGANPHTLYSKGRDSQQVPTYLRRSHTGTIASCKARAEYLNRLTRT